MPLSEARQEMEFLKDRGLNVKPTSRRQEKSNLLRTLYATTADDKDRAHELAVLKIMEARKQRKVGETPLQSQGSTEESSSSKKRKHDDDDKEERRKKHKKTSSKDKDKKKHREGSKKHK
eukprot:c13910_g1_i3.p3 GENE.c13910_g1_i3~~c13910_g1_i3.p3  ORF type:complete len:120 (-),score=32.60 c13910_g1_i3:436-795(-)